MSAGPRNISETGTRAAEIIGRLEETSRLRDGAIADCRRTVRVAANAIRALHRGEGEAAETLRDEALASLSSITRTLERQPAVYWSGYVQDAMKEVAEACCLVAIVTGSPVGDPLALGLEDAPFLNGLAEAASEMRRLILDTLRGDDIDRAETLLQSMDAVYALLIGIDFPEAITGGLRRTTDQLRAVLERTRGDVTLTLNQRRLERAIATHTFEAAGG